MYEQTLPQADDFIEPNGIKFCFRDIHQVVAEFYQAVALDPLLKVPFSTVNDWPHHIERLTHFWWVRLGGARYLDIMYNPIEKHFQAGFNKEFLERWLALFEQALSKELREDQRALWSGLAARMGESLHFKNEFLKRTRSIRSVILTFK